MPRPSPSRALAALAALASLALLAGCGGDDGAAAGGAATVAAKAASVPFAGSPEDGLPTSYPAPEPRDLTIGLLNPSGSTEVLDSIFDAAKAEVRRLGGTSVELDAQLNPDTQVSQFQQLLSRKVDAIGIYAIAGPNVLGPLLERAAQQRIPVIGFDVTPGSPKPVPGFASQIWQRRDRMTYLHVKAAAEALPKGAKVALIALAIPVPLFEYTLARQRHWAKQFGLRVVDQAESRNDTSVGSEQAAAGLLAKHPDLAGILGYADYSAVGAALAARSAGRRDLETFGFIADSLGRSAIENGRLTASVFLDTGDLGRKLAQGLYGAAEGLKLPPVVLAGDPYIVTRANAGEDGGAASEAP